MSALYEYRTISCPVLVRLTLHTFTVANATHSLANVEELLAADAASVEELLAPDAVI